MGGDRAPAMVVKGAEIALAAASRMRVFCCSARKMPDRAAAGEAAAARARSATLHHTERDGAGRRQAVAWRCAPARQSSMRLAIDAVADGRADGVVSAGNTGALMAMAKFVLKTLPGIDRPAIAIVLPDPARRERDARPRRQCRMRRREPRAVRADGRRLRPHRARARRADGRPAQCRLRGSEGKRRGARRQRPAARRR